MKKKNELLPYCEDDLGREFCDCAEEINKGSAGVFELRYEIEVENNWQKNGYKDLLLDLNFGRKISEY